MATKKQPDEVEGGDAASTTPAAKAPPKRPSILDRILSVGDMVEYDRVKLIATGASGSGKSEFMAKFPRPLILLTEKQAIPTIKRANPAAKILLIQTMTDIEEALALVASPNLYKHFDSLGVDGLTDIQRIYKDALTAMQGKRTDATDLDTWGLLIEKTARFARVVRDAVVHTVITTIDEEVSTPEGIQHRPSVYGKRLPNELAQYVNALGFLRKDMVDGEKRHSVVFDAGPLYLTKSMHGLRAVEPPEPEWLLHKAFGHPLSDAVAARVQAWEEHGARASAGHPVTKTTTATTAAASAAFD